MDCRFCLTATLGLMRNLTAGEIVGQVLVALEDNRAALKPQTNIVLMGQGEPLLNYDAVMAALRILLDPNGSGDFAEACDAFDQRDRPGNRAAGAGKSAAEAGDFAERVVERAARPDHADQPQVSAGKAARRVPELSAAAVGMADCSSTCCSADSTIRPRMRGAW